MELPDEISNHICSYIEGPNHKIISNLYFDPIECLKLNRKYKFKHINIQRLLDAINTRCPHCLNRLNPDEYIHKGTYEIIFNKKLCFDCFEREKIKIIFESNEIILLIMILVSIIRFDILIYGMVLKYIIT